MVNMLLSQYNFHEEWARDTIKEYIHSYNKVVVIPFAFSNKAMCNSVDWEKAYNKKTGKYYEQIVEPFIDLGISEENITFINYFEDTKDNMKRVIKSSDVVFLTGGLPDMAVEHVLEKDILSSINEIKIVIGVSAGALMQLNNYYISPDKDYPEFIYLKGLGLIKENFYIEVHYAETDMENNCIKKALEEKTTTVYAIKDTGGIILDSDKIRLIGDVTKFNRD